MRHPVRLTFLGLAGALALVACGGGSEGSPAVAPGAQAASTTAAPALPNSSAPATGAAVATSTTEVPATVAKVAANTASQAEIQKALEAAGVPSAAQWAREVTEYRPYPTNDPTFAKLRQNLVKYNPGPGVVDQIVSVLSL